MTFQEAEARLVAQFGSENATTVTSALNERLRKMVAESKWKTEEATLALTVANQSAYDIAADIVDIRKIRIGTDDYERVSQEDIWDLEAGRTDLIGDGGVFAPAYKADGTPQLEVYPVPTTTGTAIVAIESLLPAVIATGSTATLPIPGDFHTDLMAGARADLFREIEARPDLAEPEEALFLVAVEKLRRRKNSLVGSGTARVVLIEDY